VITELCPDHVYRRAEGVNQSTLKAFSDCPAAVQLAESTKSKPSSSQVLGLLTESLVFGTKFTYTQSPFDSYRTKEAREWRDAQLDAGITVATEEQMSKAHAMAEAVKNCPDAAALLRRGAPSTAVFHPDPKTGLALKGLLDWQSEEVEVNGKPVIVDLKTAEDPSPRGFAKAVASWRYDIQDAWYTDLWRDETDEARQFVFIVVGNEKPHAVGVYMLRDEQRAAAREQARAWLDRYAGHKASGVWPASYGGGIQYVDVAAWTREVR